MKKKYLISIFLIYFIPFIFSSCCDCYDEKKELIYTGLELVTEDTRGVENTEITSSIPMNAFGLTIHLEDEIKQITSIKSKFNMSAFGFTSAYAVVDCFCDPIELIIIDPINTIKISVENTETNEIIEVTDSFTTHEGKSINEILGENINDFYNQFNLNLRKFEDIPNSSIFSVVVKLDSGIELIEQTETILFE